jgi:glycosyltransferase involved in cell wall biosynthesis
LRRGFVTEPIAYRVARHHQQATQVFERLSHCFTPSEFGAKLFAQLGCPPEKISILPWYHDPINTRKNLSDDQPFTLTYVGRVSPEKGVDVIFSALEKDLIDEPVLLRVVGADDTPYCIYLRDKYPMSVGIHRVEWHSWTQPEALFNSTDVSIVPSIWMDNTPLSLIESLSYRVPVIATRIPTIEELLVEGETGFFADYRSTESLAYAISRAARRKHVIRQNATSFPLMYGLNEYMEKVVHQYRRIHAQCFAQ